MQIHLVCIFTFLLTACTSSLIATPTFTTTPPTTSVPFELQPSRIPTDGGHPEMTPIPSTPASPQLQNLIELAREDLAKTLSITSVQISLIKAEDVVWPNSSLGCPQEGMVYADVLTPGYLIILSADNRDYEYHTSKGTEVVHCKNPTPPVPGLSGDI